MQSTGYSCAILTKTEFSRQILEESSNIKFHANPSSGSELFQAGGRTDKTKQTVTFRNFANALKKKKKEDALAEQVVPENCQNLVPHKTV